MNSASASRSLPAQGDAAGAASDGPQHVLQLIFDDECTPQSASTQVGVPTGADILRAAGRPAHPQQVVLQVLSAGGLESIRLDERANLTLGNTFVLGVGDRLYRFTVNGKSYEWPYRRISGALVLELAGGDLDHALELTRHGETTAVAPQDLVDLSEAGLEQFITLKPSWTLIVGGVPLEYRTPLVKVADALGRAGFDIGKAWHIYLIVKGHDKQEVQLDTIVDLRTPGIEKIRVTPRNVANGDGQAGNLRREFKLMPADVAHLDGLDLSWETVCEGERRWLLIHDYALPAGLTPRVAQVALDIPKDYPASQIDMFYFSPFVARADAVEIPRVQVRATICGVEFQGWSRHRKEPHVWDANTDNVRTHMALVEGCLAKEVGQ